MLSSLGLTIRRRWLAHRPKAFQALEASGQLNAAIEDVENCAFDVDTAALHQGLNSDQAREDRRFSAEEGESETPEL